MPLITKTISLYSAFPPLVLLDRVRGLATGTLPIRRQPGWSSPVRWSLREQPGGIHLMPLSPPKYIAQGPTFIGTIQAEGCGSRVRGRVAPYPLTVGITAFLLFMDVAITTGGVAQEFSHHHPGSALLFAAFGLAFGVAAVSMLKLGVTWAAADIHRLLVTAALSEPCSGTDGLRPRPS